MNFQFYSLHYEMRWITRYKSSIRTSTTRRKTWSIFLKSRLEQKFSRKKAKRSHAQLLIPKSCLNLVENFCKNANYNCNFHRSPSTTQLKIKWRTWGEKKKTKQTNEWHFVVPEYTADTHYDINNEKSTNRNDWTCVTANHSQ